RRRRRRLPPIRPNPRLSRSGRRNPRTASEADSAKCGSPALPPGTAHLPQPFQRTNSGKEESMVTRTQSRSSNRSNSDTESRSSSSGRSAFSFGENAGPILAAGFVGAAIGFAANYGRKALMQGMEAQAGDWDE